MNLNTNFDYTDKKIIIITVFCVSFIIANVITVKILNLGFWGLDVPAGVLIYPLVYILTNVITEVYGEKAAHKTIVLGLLTNLLFVVVTTIAMIIPGPGYYTGQSSIEYVFTQTPRILLASYISYVIGNLVNARLTSIVNRGTNSKFTQIKNIGAIAFGELLDNIIFIGLVF
ncbi:MAG: queuosine precursor transporter, partial [Methanobacteriaceae archaeon]|nr:queuosine precursor transporter [Methanobacteriaceae archaeon]